jgi:hypothetical protein
MEDDVKRVTVRLSVYMYRALRFQARQAGLDFSKYLRQLLIERQPYLGAFEDIGQIEAISGKKTAPADYAPYLANMKQRLQAALDELESYESRAAGWRQEAEHELRVALADIDEQLAQASVFAHMDNLYSKVFRKEKTNEDR